jgi:hypothetical protein
MSRIGSVPSTCRFLLALGGLILAVSPSLAAAPPSLKEFTPALRERIDRLAEKHPLDTLRQQKHNVAGNISLWALGHLALDAEDELEHAQAVHKQILEHERKLETPAAAQRVLEKLLDKLPPHLKPEAFEYKLIVLDQPAPWACNTRDTAGNRMSWRESCKKGSRCTLHAHSCARCCTQALRRPERG